MLSLNKTTKEFFGYIRVSTPKQGQHGTSLSEQKDAIVRFAQRNGFTVKEWFIETETAAKRGRKVFNQMMLELQSNKADGVLMHKIDRSARNLKDWADLGELIDKGVEVYFVNENLDIKTRGGRLSADIQAVVAADYIRNLREETKKGFYGRLKQGLWPLPARIGYLNKGKGVKEPDPLQRHHVLRTFGLYATGHWNLADLTEKMYEAGLRNTKGGKVVKNELHRMLHESFYIGLMKLGTGEIFQGKHEPIVPVHLFNEVQKLLSGKARDTKHHLFFIYRKLVQCNLCKRKVIPEVQKGHTYYRCQNKECPQKTVREEVIEESFMETLGMLRFTQEELDYFRTRIKEAYENVVLYRDKQITTLRLQHDQAKSRLDKLTDAFIDGVLEKEIYAEKKNALLIEIKTLEERLKNINTSDSNILAKIEQILELANNALLTYKIANPQQKRDLVKIITSNLAIEGKKLVIELNYPFKLIENRQEVNSRCPLRDTPRTIDALFGELFEYFTKEPLYVEFDKTNYGTIKV